MGLDQDAALALVCLGFSVFSTDKPNKATRCYYVAGSSEARRAVWVLLSPLDPWRICVAALPVVVIVGLKWGRPLKEHKGAAVTERCRAKELRLTASVRSFTGVPKKIMKMRLVAGANMFESTESCWPDFCSAAVPVDRKKPCAQQGIANKAKMALRDAGCTGGSRQRRHLLSLRRLPWRTKQHVAFHQCLQR